MNTKEILEALNSSLDELVKISGTEINEEFAGLLFAASQNDLVAAWIDSKTWGASGLHLEDDCPESLEEIFEEMALEWSDVRLNTPVLVKILKFFRR